MTLKGEMTSTEEIDPASLLKQTECKEKELESGEIQDEEDSGERIARKCDFCDKDQKDVKHLIAGSKANICDECIGLCNDIIFEQSGNIPGKINPFTRTVDGHEMHLVADLATKSVRWTPEDSMKADPMSVLCKLLNYEENGSCPDA